MEIDLLNNFYLDFWTKTVEIKFGNPKRLQLNDVQVEINRFSMWKIFSIRHSNWNL